MASAFSLADTWDDGKRVYVSGTVIESENSVTSGDKKLIIFQQAESCGAGGV
jgi:hypothetical protein